MRKGPNPRIFFIMAMAALAVGLGLVYMQFNAMSSAGDRVVVLKKESRDVKEIRGELDKSQQRLADCSTELKHLEEGVPEAAYVPTMLTDLEKVGTQSGLLVTGVRPLPKPVAKKGEKDTRKAYDELAIQVKGQGNYESVMAFVSALNSFPKIVAARTVSLSPKTDGTKGAPTDRLDVEIELKAYVFSKDKPADGGIKQDG